MEVIKTVAKRATHTKVHKHVDKFIDTVRFGWNNYSFLFYIGGVSAILGEMFGLAGWSSVIFTLLFFYYAGKLKKQLEIERKKEKKRDKLKKHQDKFAKKIISFLFW